jgi:hypothetical protein
MLDVDPKLSRTQRDAKEAQKPFLAEEVECEWPRIAERDRCSVPNVRDP